jgi:serine/threonine-protein kinase
MNVLKRFRANRLARRLLATETGAESVAEAREQLLALGPSAIRAIFDSLEGERARGPALEVLEELLTDAALPAFVDALKSEKLAVVETATLVLSNSRSYDATPLLPLFSDPDVSRARLETILSEQVSSLQPKLLLQLMPDLSRDARASVFRLLEKHGDESIAPGVARLAQHSDWWMRQGMAKLLAKYPGEETIETLIKLLKDEVSAVRLAAVHGLGALKATTAIEALCTRLGDPDMKVQGAAIEALIAIGDVRAVSFLLEYLKNDSEYVRRGAVEVLNQVVTADAIKDLVSALRDQDWWVRVRAADALGTLGGDRVVEAVVSLIDDRDDFVRRYCVEILNMVPDGRSVEPLIHALEDSDWWVRERAIDALAKVGDARAVDPLLGLLARDPRVIPLCIRALGAIGDERGVDTICRLSSSDNSEIRTAAIEALGALAKRDISSEARTQIGSTLEALGATPGRAGFARAEGRAFQGPEVGRKSSDTPRPGGSPTPSRSSDSPAPTPSGAFSTPGSTPSGASLPVPGAAPALNYQRLDPGVVLGDRWRVVRRIGGGGFGTVYLVQDIIVNEDMVLKILSQHLSQDEGMIKRFVQELKLTRKITHRNVIRIYDLVDLEGAHAISMEYFEGRDLGHVIREAKALPVDRVLHIIGQVLQGLACAHELGIYHRDIKPGNILVGADDDIKIVDFGLASVGHSSRSRLTQSGILIGTPEYISPEQITGKAIDGRADLYSLACVMYYMLSGVEPFSGDTAVQIIFQHVEGEAKALSGVATVPQALSDYIMRVLSKDPDQRPSGALEMMLDLERLREAA